MEGKNPSLMLGRGIRMSNDHAIVFDGRSIEQESVGRFRLARKRAAIALLWQPSKPDLSLREQSRIAGGSQGGFDLAVPFGSGRQFGFGSTRDGHVPGMIAGASLFSGKDWDDNWLAAFGLPGPRKTWWIFAMRGGLVYEDQLHFELEAARAAFESSLKAPDWERIIAPREWEVPSSDHVELQDAVSFDSRVRLRRINRLPRLAAAAGASLLTVVLVNLAWSGYVEMRSIDPVQDEDSTRRRPVEYELPWKNVPKIATFSRACVSEIERLAVLAPGWKLVSVECFRGRAGIGTTSTWERSGGSPVFLRAAVEAETGLEVRLGKDGKRAQLSVERAIETTSEHEDKQPWDGDFLRATLHERFQHLGLILKMAERSERLRGNGSVDRTAHVGRHDLSITTSAGIEEIARLLSDVPALVPKELIYKPGDDLWLLAAKAYHPVEQSFGGFPE